MLIYWVWILYSSRDQLKDNRIYISVGNMEMHCLLSVQVPQLSKTLLRGWGLDWMTFNGPFQHKLVYDFMMIMYELVLY